MLPHAELSASIALADAALFALPSILTLLIVHFAVCRLSPEDVKHLGGWSGEVADRVYMAGGSLSACLCAAGAGWGVEARSGEWSSGMHALSVTCD